MNVPLRPPVETAAGVLRTAPLVLIDVLTDEGVTGVSYLRCYTPHALGALVRLVVEIEPLIAGFAATPAELADRLDAHFRLLGMTGLVRMAAAGVDLAAWDACARRRGVPLVTLLGGAPTPVPAYVSLRSMRAAAAAAEAEAAVTQGLRGVKVKLGGGDLDDDIAVVDAVRASIGAEIELMVDYNQSLTVDEALRRAAALDERDVAWIEEPTRGDDFDGHGRIAAAARSPIQLGESIWSPAELERAVAARASDHVMLSAMKIGGVTGWLRAASIADAAGLPVSSHAFPEISAHLLGVTPTRHRLELGGGVASLLDADPLLAADGAVMPSDAPGNGLRWDERAVKRCLCAR